MAWNKVSNLKGPQGDKGVRGVSWFTGNGAPPASVTGALPNDLYLDLTTGDVYTLS